MNLKPLLSTIAALLLSLSTFGQKQTERKYKFMLKLVENNVWRNYYEESSLALDDPNSTDINKFILLPANFKFKQFGMGVQPSFVIFTKRQDQIEIGLSANLKTEKNTYYDGKALVEEVNTKRFGINFKKKIYPKNLTPESVDRNLDLNASISASYNFRLSKKELNTVFLLGPSLLAYHSPDDNSFIIPSNQSNGIAFGISPKWGYHAGKRMYLEMAMPFTFYKIDRAENNDEYYLIYTNYLKKIFNKTDYDRIFKLQFSIGYKL